MLQNAFLVAYRNMMRRKLHSVINILGLWVSFTAAIIIFQYVHFEFAMDDDYPDVERLYRIGTLWEWHENGNANSANRGAFHSFVAEALLEDFPEEIESFCWGHPTEAFPEFRGAGGSIRVKTEYGPKISVGDFEPYVVSPNFLEFFGFSMYAGDPKTALQEPNSVALSESAVQKYFGDRNPIGEVIEVGELQWQVTGIFEDIPKTSSWNAIEILFSNVALKPMVLKNRLVVTDAFMKVAPNVDVTQLHTKVLANNQRYYGQLFEDAKAINLYAEPIFYLFKDWWTDHPFMGPRGSDYSIKQLRLLQIIAVVILLMAYFNYTNLSIAKMLNRIKAMGIRKVVGARRHHLLLQFTCESLLINVISLALAITSVQVLSSWTGLEGTGLMNLGLWLLVSGLFLLGVVLSSLYPAILSYRLGGALLVAHSNSARITMRFPKILLFVQYLCSAGLLIYISLVSKQLAFISNYDLGYEQEGVMALKLPVDAEDNTASRRTYFQNRLSAMQRVRDFTISYSVPGEPDYVHRKGEMLRRKTGDVENVQIMPFSNGGVDEDFFDFYDLKFLAGANFSSGPAATHQLIITRTIAHRLGFDNPEDAIGISTDYYNNRPVEGATFFANSPAVMTIVGVVEDYRVLPLYQTPFIPGSMIFTYKQTVFDLPPRICSIKYDPEGLPELLNNLESLYAEVFPEVVMDHFFIKDLNRISYEKDRNLRMMLLVGSGLSLLISCLGLFGLVSVILSQRVKEIGIRKVLGAGSAQLLQTFGRSYVYIVTFAAIVAAPLGYLASRDFLEKFADRIDIGIGEFLIPLLVLAGLALLLVAVKVMDASRMNPVNALRDE